MPAHSLFEANPVARNAGRLFPVAGSIEMMGATMSFPRNAEIYGEGEPADYLYRVASGAVRVCKILADGRRQIGAFFLPGDVFGLEAGNEHAFSAEAITETKVLVIKRSSVMAMAARDTEIARQLWTMAARELQRVQERLMLLVKTAEERVVGFLLEMIARLGNADDAVAVVELPMPRQDIADYLGLTIETVSRTMSQLEQTAAIALPSSRRVVIRNPATLQQLNG